MTAILPSSEYRGGSPEDAAQRLVAGRREQRYRAAVNGEVAFNNQKKDSAPKTPQGVVSMAEYAARKEAELNNQVIQDQTPQPVSVEIQETADESVKETGELNPTDALAKVYQLYDGGYVEERSSGGTFDAEKAA